MSVNIFSAITAQALSECWIPQQLRPLILSPAHHSQWTFKWEPTVAFITSLGGAGSVMKIRYTTNPSPVITTQPTSQLVSVGNPVTFSVTASGPSPYSYQWMRNGVNISDATARTYRIASTTLSDNGARFRVRVSNAFGNTLSNVAPLSVTSDKPPLGRILTPVQGTTYFGGMVVNYSGSASDVEDGDLPASA